MTAELDALWNEFAAETEDHLNSLERLLSDPAALSSASEIGALFRYFHSLKGSFLAMGFNNVEAVAHRCEDILSLVRDGKTILDPALARTLLRAVDHLKDMRDNVLATQKDARPAKDLLAELAKHCNESPGNSKPLPDTTQDLQLSDDPEMLGIYSELLEQRLASTADALSNVASERAIAAETASDLGYGADMMGFESLSGHLNALAELASAPSERRKEKIELFGEIREQVKIIEDLTGHRSGAEPLAAALAQSLEPDYATGLDALEAAADPSAPGTDLLAAAQSLHALALCQGFEQTLRLLILIEEKFRAPNEVHADQRTNILALIRDTISTLRASLRTDEDIAPADAEGLVARWSASLQAPRPTASTELHLSPRFATALAPEQASKLQKAVAEGHHAFELLLDLESHPEVAGDVLAWLSTAVQAITSQTAHRRGAGCFDFLITSANTADWVRAQLAALDPEQVCLREIKVLGDDPSHAVDESPAVQDAAAPSRTPLIRVPSERVDDLMAEIGEMRSALATLADILHNGGIARTVRDSRRLDRQSIGDDSSWKQARDAMDADLRDLRALHNTLESAHRRIWSVGLQLRVIPIDGLFSRLSRAARDLADKLGKEIDLVIDGREVRIDKSMVDGLIDPLMHMVRNAVDHGIETPAVRAAAGKPRRATLTISASEHGNRIEAVIADDGRGLDRNRIVAKAVQLDLISAADAEDMTDAEVNALIFRPGFSTAGSITEISGRGVGLDVVEAALQRLGGTIDVQSVAGAGTRFTLKLPISAALLRALLVEVDGQIFAFAERQVVSVQDTSATEIEHVAGQSFVLHRGASVPVRRLSGALGLNANKTASAEAAQLVIVTAGARMLGFGVDRVLHFQDLFLKELHPVLAAIPTIAGTSVLGDGRPVLVLDATPLGTVETLH